jgi:TonB family protein
MEFRSYNAEGGPGAGERRSYARLTATSIIAVALGDLNGGIALNISEGGLALSAAYPLPNSQVFMRIQFPGSREWIEIKGQIAWKGDSSKEAGMGFVDLTGEARQRIRDWISSQAWSQPCVESTISSETQLPLFAETDSAHQGSIPNPLIPGPAQEDQTRGVPSSTDPESCMDPTKGTFNECAPQLTWIANGKSQDPETSSPFLERRMYPRKRIVPLGYLRLGDGNGGIALNVSEGGLAITAAVILAEDELPSIRLQFPDSSEWIEASGQIAWRSESKKEAGVRFVALTQQARLQLTDWISLQPTDITEQTPADLRQEEKNSHSELPNVREAEPLIQAPSPSASAPDETRQNSPIPPATALVLDDIGSPMTASADALSTRARRDRKRVQPKPKPASRPSIIRPKRRRAWVAFATVCTLIGFISFVKNWITSRPDIYNEAIAAVTQKQRVLRETFEDAVRRTPTGIPAAPMLGTQKPDQTASNLAPPPAPSDETIHNPSQTNPTKRAYAEEPPSVTTPRKIPGPNSKTVPVGKPGKQVPSPPAVSLSGPILDQMQLQTVNRLPAALPKLELRAAAPVSTMSPTVSSPPPLDLKNKQLSPLPLAPEMRANVAGTVAILTDPYLSIRIPDEHRLKTSSRGATLQLGQLVSRIEPVYPEEAKQQGIEGTVKIHAIIGRSGSVENLTTVNGPPLLVPPTVNAVRQWRYTETLIGGQPVQTEDNITVTFRLSNPVATMK